MRARGRQLLLIARLGYQTHGSMPAHVVKRLEITGAVAKQQYRPPGNVYRAHVALIGKVAGDPGDTPYFWKQLTLLDGVEILSVRFTGQPFGVRSIGEQRVNRRLAQKLGD